MLRKVRAQARVTLPVCLSTGLVGAPAVTVWFAGAAPGPTALGVCMHLVQQPKWK